MWVESIMLIRHYIFSGMQFGAVWTTYTNGNVFFRRRDVVKCHIQWKNTSTKVLRNVLLAVCKCYFCTEAHLHKFSIWQWQQGSEVFVLVHNPQALSALPKLIMPRIMRGELQRFGDGEGNTMRPPLVKHSLTDISPRRCDSALLDAPSALVPAGVPLHTAGAFPLFFNILSPPPRVRSDHLISANYSDVYTCQ